MTFGESISTCFKKYAAFDGRATKSEFWWWFLFTFLASIGSGTGGVVSPVGWSRYRPNPLRRHPGPTNKGMLIASIGNRGATARPVMHARGLSLGPAVGTSSMLAAVARPTILRLGMAG